MGNIIMNVQEADKFLRLSVCAVYRYGQREILPHIRKGFGLSFRRPAHPGMVTGEGLT